MLAGWWRYYQVVILRETGDVVPAWYRVFRGCNLVQLCRLRDPKIQEEYRAFIYDKVGPSLPQEHLLTRNI